jgi:hypothetical protein
MSELKLKDLQEVINILNKSKEIPKEQKELFEEYYYNQKVNGIKLIDRLNETMKRNDKILNKKKNLK